MATFYKYMPYLGVSFLNSPTIRISSAQHLNDPFEGELTDFELEELSKKINESNPGFDFPLKGIRVEYRNKKTSCGIVSLTTQYDNILMWSHYADQHCGIVLELEEDFLGEESQERDYRPYYIKPHKVNYYTTRQNSIDSNGDIQILLENSLTKKSQHWKYEDEYRCIVPLESSDILRYKKGNIELDENYYLMSIYPDSRPFIDESINDDWVSLRLCDALIEPGPNNYTLPKARTEFCGAMANRSEDCLFLKEIDIRKIKSIYLGRKMNPQHIKEILGTLNNKPEWDHLSVYRLNMKSDTYELEPIQLMANGLVLNPNIFKPINLIQSALSYMGKMKQ